MSADAQDRRNFYRLDDDIIFDFIILQDDEQNAGAAAFDDDPIMQAMELIAELKSIDNNNQPLLQNINLQSPQTADYLRGINRKINRITQYLTEELLAKVLLKTDARTTCKVNLSGGGLAFYHHEAIPQESLLQLKMILLPGYQCVITEGRVVGCEQEKNPQTAAMAYRIACQFDNLSDTNEQLIIRHIYQRQIDARKQPDDAADNE